MEYRKRGYYDMNEDGIKERERLGIKMDYQKRGY